MFAERIRIRRRGWRLWLAPVLAAAALLVFAAAAWAAWVTIDTNNDALDGTWGTAFYTSTCTNGSVDNRGEIKNAWIRNNGVSIYFRMEVCQAPALTFNTNLRATGALDCNQDGDFTDPYIIGPEGDRIVNYNPDETNLAVAILDGEGILTGTYTNDYGERPPGSLANMEWKVDLRDIPPDCQGSVHPINAAVVVLNVDTRIVVDSSTVVQYSIPLDYGDLADPVYLTVLTSNGARHGLQGSALMLGVAVDADSGTLQNATASADDANGAPDDEDGVWPTPGVNWVAGGSGKIDATVSGGPGYLTCWADWTQDSDFADTGEKIVPNVSFGAGQTTQTLTFSVPATVTFPNTYNVRCRLYKTSQSSAAVTGASEFGEVEDHQWAFGAGGVPPAPPATPVAVTTLAITPDGASDVLLSWTHNSANQQYRVLKDATDPYFSSAEADDDLGIVSAAPWEMPDPGVYGLPVETYYYIVLGRVGSIESDPSNRVGLFEFALQPGSE